jgi:hypothetical protein
VLPRQTAQTKNQQNASEQTQREEDEGTPSKRRWISKAWTVWSYAWGVGGPILTLTTFSYFALPDVTIEPTLSGAISLCGPDQRDTFWCRTTMKALY